MVFEQEFLQITAGLEGVSGVPARLLITACDAAGLATMNQQIDLASEQLATCDPDVVLYGCTSGSFMDGNAGEQAIVQRISAIVSKPVATLSQAVLAAMKRNQEQPFPEKNYPLSPDPHFDLVFQAFSDQ